MSRNLACIILAAGQSSRMTRSKIVLPWGESTVIGTIITSFHRAGIRQIVVVTGGYHELVENEVKRCGAQTVFNPEYANGEMSLSLQTGLGQLEVGYEGIFVALGDQPEIHPDDILGMIKVGEQNPQNLIIPSYAMRRGHPWLVPAQYFSEIRQLHTPDTMKTFIQRHEDEISYYVVKKSNILADLDTPEDYERYRPKAS